MANLVNDLGNAIKTVLSAAAFDAAFAGSVTASAHTEYGYEWRTDTSDKYGRVIVRPLGQAPDLDDPGQTSTRTIFHYEIVAELRVDGTTKTPHERLNQFHQLMLTNFADGGQTLSASVTDNGSNILPSGGTDVVVTLGEQTLEVVDAVEPALFAQDTPRVRYQLDVKCWHKLPLA